MASAAVRETNELRSRGFTLSNPPLTPIERAVLGVCEKAAAEGRELDSIEDMRMELGALSYSTVPGVMKRLEEKGYITRQIFQRGRLVCITSTGQCTLPPRDQTPHWRVRTDRVPSPAIQAIRERSKSAADRLEALAKRENRSVAEMAMLCALVGLDEIEREDVE